MSTTKPERFDYRLARAVAREMLQRGWRPLPDGLVRPPRGVPNLPEPIGHEVWKLMCQLEERQPA